MRYCLLLLVAVTLAACARPSEPPTGARAKSPIYESRGLPPDRRPPPTAAYSSETSLLVERVAESVNLYDKDRWERFVDAMDPGELLSDMRIQQSSIDRGEWKPEWLFQNGDDIFEHEIGPGEGYGPGRSRVHRPGLGGPDATACAECHHRGGFNGAGDLSENTFFDGDGSDPASAFERNPPALLGLGIEQRLANEITADLLHTRENAVANAKSSHRDQTVALGSAGIAFGELTAHPDGTLDTSKVVGVDPDLIVKPFGWKGNFPSLESFVAGGFQAHFGMQAAARKDAPGPGPEWDRDNDGTPYEISEGMLTTVVLYLSRLEIPVMIPPRDPALLERHALGFEIFRRSECAACHTPSLALRDPHLRISDGLVTNVLTDGETPRPRVDVYAPGVTGVPIFLFSDLKRHAMGPALAEHRATEEKLTLYDRSETTATIAADTFLTRPLWGLADTAPYLHDGRARTLDDAILAHGGEAEESAKRFRGLSKDEKIDLRIFLLSLTRYPRIDYR